VDDRRLAPLLGAVAFALLVLASSPAAAEPCSVVRKCSATGLACLSGDQKCEAEASSRGLQVVCDNVLGPDQKQFVWCPPVTEARDSKIVWVLLSVALALAIGGGVVVWSVLKKKPAA